MICPNEHGPVKHGPDVECADCRGFAAVSERLDEFAAPEVSPGFDARLYARIAAEEARKPWWYRLLWPPIAPVAVAAVAAVIMFVHVPGHQDAAKHESKADIEQVAQAVDDLDLLVPLADTRDK
jgi:hypothetical protein